MKTDSINEALKAAPPLGVGGLSLWGVPLDQWVLIATLLYTVFLLIDKLPVVIARVRSLWGWLTKKETSDVQGD